MGNNNHIDMLLEHGIKPSYQRIKVLEYLTENKNHPTVERIYSELVHEIPTLSKTTVYNTLNLFAEADIVKSLTIEGNELRYDADVREHGHFMCERCGNIYDFNINIESMHFQGLEHFHIIEKNVFFKGICNNCL